MLLFGTDGRYNGHFSITKKGRGSIRTSFIDDPLGFLILFLARAISNCYSIKFQEKNKYRSEFENFRGLLLMRTAVCSHNVIDPPTRSCSPSNPITIIKRLMINCNVQLYLRINPPSLSPGLSLAPILVMILSALNSQVS